MKERKGGERETEVVMEEKRRALWEHERREYSQSLSYKLLGFP